MGSVFFILKTKSPKIEPNIAEGLDQWPENRSLGVRTTIQEWTDAIRSLTNGRAVGSDEVPVELFKIVLNGGPALRQRLLDIVVGIWRGGRVPHQWKDATIEVLQKVDRIECRNNKIFSLVVKTRRLSDYFELEGTLHEKQGGFRPNRSTTYIMFVIRRL